MEWQEWIVWGVGLATAAVIIRRIRRALCGKRKGGLRFMRRDGMPLEKTHTKNLKP